MVKPCYARLFFLPWLAVQYIFSQKGRVRRPAAILFGSTNEEETLPKLRLVSVE